jgi:hypothetical protein
LIMVPSPGPGERGERRSGVTAEHSRSRESLPN